jgi:hypothetical protein
MRSSAKELTRTMMEMAVSTWSPGRTMDVGSDSGEGVDAASNNGEGVNADSNGRGEGVLAGGAGIGGRGRFRAS